jgi:mono/diheme cytochrome c family protein
MSRNLTCSTLSLVLALIAIEAGAAAGDLAAASTTAGSGSLESFPAGYRHLLNNEYVPPQMDQEVFDNLWRTWEEPLKSQAEKATPEERRKMAFSRYGLMEAPGREGGIPLQYADNGKGGWVLNCFSCHGGKVAGQVIPGLPNTHIALETLFQEIVEAKRLLGRKVPPVELGAVLVPLGKSNGTTNAIIFGVVLGAYRDKDLNVHLENPAPKMIHHDHDAPPWWNVKRKTHLYSDGFAVKSHRALMQFMMTFSNGPDAFHRAENDYKEIYAWIESLEPPKYPWDIDAALAAKGHQIFNKTCAECHGTYGDGSAFPQKIVSIDEVGTDRARLDALTPEMRLGYEQSWFANYGEKKSIVDPGGYVAQPLNGIWASAPYLHNGSVPTLWHLFHPDKRPVVWKRTEDGYDREKVGLEVTEYEAVPAEVKSPKERRTYFDSHLFGKSVQGHTFPDVLNEDEKVAVIEYLKTL